MIKSLINPFIFPKKNITHSSCIFFYKYYSNLPQKTDNHSQSQISDLTTSNERIGQNLSLVIDQNFIKMLEQRLSNANFKSLPYKQDEINKLIYKLENPFHLFYLYEKYSNEFNSFNLVNVIKKMAYFSRSKNLTENGLFFIPDQINKSLTKHLIKTGPQFESFQCLTILAKLVQLGYKINDYSVKTMLQLLKFHVNELELFDLIQCKKFLNTLKMNPDGTLSSNEYAENLDIALNLAVQIKYQDLKNVKQSINLLDNFSSSLSETNLENIINFIYHRLSKKEEDQVVNLIRIMAERNFFHLKLFFKIKKIVLRQKLSDSTQLKLLHGSFLKLKFYDTDLQDYFIEKQIENAKDASFDVEIFNDLLESSLLFVHKSLPLLDYIADNKPYNQNFEKFSLNHFIVYSALTGYERITDNLPELVEKFLDQKPSDDSRVSVLKSLCWINQMTLANKVLSSIEVPQNLNTMDKLFIREVFDLNLFKIDDKLPIKTKLEEKLEETVNRIENYEISNCSESIETASYFKNFEILDLNFNKKCVVQFSNLNGKFRNIGEYTNSFKFRKNFLIKAIKSQCDSEDFLYWILETKKFQNLGENFDNQIKKTLDEIYQKINKL